MQDEHKTVLPVTDVAAHLNIRTKALTTADLQQDFNYMMAQATAEAMLSGGLISLVEFNKITELNRDTFSPMLREIMPRIT